MIAQTSHWTSVGRTRRTSDFDTSAPGLHDNNCSQITKTVGSVTITYGWDLQGHLVGIDNTSDQTVDVTYSYNSDGVRVAETADGTTTYYLNDPQNPTGYTKAIEDRSDTNSDGVADHTVTAYILGSQIIGQVSSTATYYLLVDGHGSTRALTSTTGGIVESYDFDAYGIALNFDPNTAMTNWLFGGDGLWDPNSLFTYHLARFRDGERFISYDTFEADPTTPASLHKYLYASVNPVGAWDPSGEWSLTELKVVVAILAILATISGDSITGHPQSMDYFDVTVRAGDDDFNTHVLSYDLDVTDAGLTCIKDMADAIRDSVAARGRGARLKNLVLYGHASSSHIRLLNPQWGQPYDWTTAVLLKSESGQTTFSTDQFLRATKSLPHTYDWTIELYGCSTGGGFPPGQFLQAVANESGATVIGYDADVPVQSDTFWWLFGAHKVIRYPQAATQPVP